MKEQNPNNHDHGCTNGNCSPDGDCCCGNLRGGTLVNLAIITLILAGGFLLAQNYLGGDPSSGSPSGGNAAVEGDASAQQGKAAGDGVQRERRPAVESVVSHAVFDAKMAQGKDAVLVVFSAPWCPACRTYEPVFEKAAVQLSDKANFYKVNVDNVKSLAEKYGIQYLPTTILFRQGKEVTRFTGVKDAAGLGQLLAK